MKRTFKVITILLGVVVLYGASLVALSELGGEVVTLARPELDGSTKNIRVWIVAVSYTHLTLPKICSV